MTKTELVKKIADSTQIEQTKIDKVINSAIQIITDTVANGDKVQFVGFGTFEMKKRSERNGRNPQTGESIIIEARNVPYFSAGNTFKKAVNL